MSTAKISLSPSVKAPGSVTTGASLLNKDGPEIVLGWVETEFAVSNAPSPSVLFGPRGACLLPDGSLWVADTGHHRLLGWKTGPKVDNQPADLLIGQPDFVSEGRNAKGAANASTLNVPTGVSPWGKGLAVADAWNHRVLLWKTVPVDDNQPADIILGQINANDVLANFGKDQPQANSMHWPYGVAEIDGRLVVSDSGNRRVLVWNDPEVTGQPADLVIGQATFDERHENAGQEVGPAGMRWPHATAFWNGHFAVTDAGNNRVMLWTGFPTQNGQACDLVLGQSDFSECDHNQKAYYPDAKALNMPYAITVNGDQLLVADTANSRLLGWQDCAMNSDANRLMAQPDFASKGDNGWGVARRDSVCWPYGLTCHDGMAVVSDSGNNRILLWRIEP
ncbi:MULTISPECIES: hypothetical protein [Pseudomonadota]|jgi:hypothetical protein|uniref:hypothetical protein n=1 Tax=Pseudomonadota TaxID=1224 RepID=UPI000C47F5B5|nr:MULTISPECIES: hypothetical protein [Pseudomonadota]MBM07803.1 hypothetical protein [Sulfitobacter sp.]MBO6686890.1 hypothetical protein [Henriciella sp.]MAL43281.1 hypothetical protein [Hyphomonas sp.]MBE95014.1 hypothetical protein [Marinobacter sp.]MBL4878509.1 hypothetical protein [Hyphomonas sp.]|tara:strand:+ start:11659 stop:12837 length:1179 start_codon:yes stop_codon:yes gene_type:complete